MPAASPPPGGSSQRVERVRLDLLPARMTREDDLPAWPRASSALGRRAV